MTVPIVPGPFSFLSSAGEAAGNYGAIREERKRHGEELAAAGAQSVMAQIMQGYKPASILADPEVQALFKKAYGVSIPGAILPQPKEIIQTKTANALTGVKPGGAAERAVTGVPSEDVAGAGEATTTLAGQRATATMAAGLPAIEAQTAAATAQAQREGAVLNANIFKGANALLGNDPKYARLAYEAATGALDARLRQLEFNRYSLSLDRQQAADNTRILLGAMNEGAKQYDQAMTKWQGQLQAFLLEKGDTPDARQAFAQANPPPDQHAILDSYVQSQFGFGVDEFQRRLTGSLNKLTGGDEGGAAPPPKATDKPGQNTSQTQPTGQPGRLEVLVGNAAKIDPVESGQLLSQAVRDQDITDLEAAAVVARLRAQQPASWFKKFNGSYSASSLSGGSGASGDPAMQGRPLQNFDLTTGKVNK